MSGPPESAPRIPLTRDRILAAAIALADRDGTAGLTMRNLAAELGVEAMSLYHHVANKQELLDGVIDRLVEEVGEELGGFDVSIEPGEWKSALRCRAVAARTVMLRHKWAPAMIEARTGMTPTLLRYMDSVLGIMAAGGFTHDLAHHAMHALGSLPLGFNRELFAPADPGEGDGEAEALLEQFAEQVPHIVAMLAGVAHQGPEETIGWCDDQIEFEFTLDLMLDGLEQRLSDA